MSIGQQDQIREQVRNRYADIAKGGKSCCGGSSPDALGAPQASMQLGYSEDDLNVVPDGANMGLGCGNPQAIASLKPGEVVVDLGSGGGFDCFLASKQVGESGLVIGVDMTPDMVSKARSNALKGGYTNTQFRLGEIEYLPVADESVDVIISNCVINLSPDKRQVIKEARRVLKTGGRLAISDVVLVEAIPSGCSSNMDAYCGCITGAVTVEEFGLMLEESGFEQIEIDINQSSGEFIRDWIPDSGLERYVRSASIKAFKSGV